MATTDQPDSLDFILANVCHLHYARVHQLLEEIGLYRGQPQLLKALWEVEGMTQTALAERLKIAPATITRMLQRMEKAGFVTRRVDTQDLRVSRVYLTAAGREIKQSVEHVWEMMEAETFASFSAEEKTLLSGFLLQLRENLLQATGEEPWE